MRRILSLLALALTGASVALVPVQQQPQVRTVGHLDMGMYRSTPRGAAAVQFGPAVSPNGRFLAITTRDSLLVMEVASGRHWTLLRGTTGGRNEFEYVDWSPKGDMLSFDRGDDERKTDFIWTLPIDQNTGRATGEAQRVSTTDGDLSAISPDGEWIAFADYVNPGQRIVIVPARGGRERVLAVPRESMSSITWSAGGDSIYYVHFSRQPRMSTLSRVAAAGGASQVVWQTRGSSAEVIKPGPKIVSYEPDRMIRILDTGGKTTRALLRAPQGRSVWLTSANSDATRFYAVAENTPHRLMRVSLADGSWRLLDTSHEPHGISTSAAGSRIVYRTLVDGRRRLVATNTDGTERREYRTQREPRGGEALSPDGTQVAYQSLDSLARLVVLDLQSGRERVVASAHGFGTFRWRSDGRLQYVRLDSTPSVSRALHEVTVDGRDRLVRMHPNPASLGDGFGVLNDSFAILAPRGRIELVPLPRGDTRVIFQGPHAGVTLSPDQRLLAIKTVGRLAATYANSTAVALPETDAIAIVDLQTGERRNIQLDARMRTSVSSFGSRVHSMWWHPDGRNLIVSMSRPGEMLEDVFLVPINGDRPRLIQRGASSDTRVSVMPDGRTVMVSVAGPASTAFLEFTLPGAPSGGRR